MSSEQPSVFDGQLVLCVLDPVSAASRRMKMSQSHLLRSSGIWKLCIESSNRLEISGNSDWKLTIDLTERKEGIEVFTPVETSFDWEFGFYLFRFLRKIDGEAFHEYLKARRSDSVDDGLCDSLMIPDNCACDDQELIESIERHLSDPPFLEYLNKVERIWDQIYTPEI